MASLITPLCRVRRVDQFAYLICLNQTPDVKVIGFANFNVSKLTHTVQTGLVYWSDRFKQI
jgi:hypothetical protein